MADSKFSQDFLLSDDAENDEALKRFLVGLEQSHYEVAQFCYDCIRQSDLKESEINISKLPDDEEPKLLKYAIKHWMEHVKASGWAEKNFDSTGEFFKSDSKLRKNWWTAYLEDAQNDDPKNFKVTSLAHLSAYFGILPWIKPAFEGKSWFVKHGSVLMELDRHNRTPLHIAVEQGHGAIVQLLMDQGIDVTAKEASQFATPLHLAARNGHKEICETLLNYKARINARNMFKHTPLTEAARVGHFEVVKLLVNRGADVNGSIDKHSRSIYRHMESVPFYVKRRLRNVAGASYEQRSTPVIEAARRSHTEIIRYLVEKKKADIEAKTLAGQNALHIAAYHGQTKSMEVLVELSASIEKKDDSSQTPLFLASWQNNPEAVRWLVEKKANTDTATNRGFTPLHVAARNGCEEPMKILLEAHAKFEYQDEKGHTPLSIAALWGKAGAVKILIEYDANIEAQDLAGNTALMQAIQGNLTDKHMEIVNLLLEHSANVEHHNRKGLTPLMKAAEIAEDDAAEIVQQLLDKGAAIDAQDNEGRTVLMHAFVEGTKKTRELLLSNGAALETKDGLGDTALIFAAGYSTTNAVQWLLECGANSDVRDDFGYTPLIKAVKCGYEGTVKLLLDRGANIDAVDNENKSVMDHAVIRGRGQMIKLLMARGANRRKRTVINHAAAALSDLMYLTEEVFREWEREWEATELKKTNRTSRERQDSDLSKADEETLVKVDTKEGAINSNIDRDEEEKKEEDTKEEEETTVKETVPDDADSKKTKEVNPSEEDTVLEEPETSNVSKDENLD